MNVWRLRAAAFLGVAFAAPLAFAGFGPPFITDDPEPVDFLHYEVYVASIHSDFGGAWGGSAPHIEVNYGAVPNVQLHVISPWAYAAGPGQPTNFGYGTTEFGIKYRFINEKGRTPMVGIFPLLEVSTGSAARGLSSGKNATFLPLWVQKGVGAWTIYGGAGFWHTPADGLRDYWYSGVTAQCQTTKKLMLGFEVFHTTPQAVGTGDVGGFNLGGIYDLDEGHHLMFSAGTGWQGPDHGTAYVAYQWTFGPHEKKDDKENESK